MSRGEGMRWKWGGGDESDDVAVEEGLREIFVTMTELM